MKKGSLITLVNKEVDSKNGAQEGPTKRKAENLAASQWTVLFAK